MHSSSREVHERLAGQPTDGDDGECSDSSNGTSPDSLHPSGTWPSPPGRGRYLRTSRPSKAAYDGAYDHLISRARAPEPNDAEIRAFNAELQQALADPGQLPAEELFDAVDYGDGSDEAFLRRLWHDLYNDQPDTPGAGADPHRASGAETSRTVKPLAAHGHKGPASAAPAG